MEESKAREPALLFPLVAFPAEELVDDTAADELLRCDVAERELEYRPDELLAPWELSLADWDVAVEDGTMTADELSVTPPPLLLDDEGITSPQQPMAYNINANGAAR